MSKLDKIFKNSKKYHIDDNTKLVIMSDCHRGTGDNFDNFVKNKNIVLAALRHYYINGFTYIELGDGDEMWEVDDYKDIVKEHIDTFRILKKFNDSKRLIMVYGNHDIVKRKPKVLEDTFHKYYNNITNKNEDLLTDLKVYESLVLDYKDHDIFLIHGHQVDLLNSTFWYLAAFLVNHLWKPLENIGIKDPTSAAKNYQVTKKTEKKLKKWSMINNKMLIAGHTHRPIFPKIGQSLYFNDGSCIHPNGITCIEIENGKITLVKWSFNISNDKILFVERKIVEGKEPIINFFLNKTY
ncbi:MAG: metallophosphoesterase family protein [Bacilli bacterium]|nr:metallophosphoesterase family protein [Bacilli bacterium]